MAFNLFDPAKSLVQVDLASSPLAGPNDVDVSIHLHERPRFAASQTANMGGDGEVSGQMSARAENVFGGAERVEGTLQAGTLTKNAWEITFQTPIAARPDIWGELGVFRMARDQKYFASHELLQRGAYLKLKAPAALFSWTDMHNRHPQTLDSTSLRFPPFSDK
jgi:outer membrane protein insertion porin family